MRRERQGSGARRPRHVGRAVGTASTAPLPPPVRTAQPKEIRMSAKFEVYEDNAGKHRFRLKSANGEIIAVGEGYTTKNACLNGIESVKKNAAEAAVVETDA
jgi:uncharacterized protein